MTAYMWGSFSQKSIMVCSMGPYPMEKMSLKMNEVIKFCRIPLFTIQYYTFNIYCVHMIQWQSFRTPTHLYNQNVVVKSIYSEKHCDHRYSLLHLFICSDIINDYCYAWWYLPTSDKISVWAIGIQTKCFDFQFAIQMIEVYSANQTEWRKKIGHSHW